MRCSSPKARILNAFEKKVMRDHGAPVVMELKAMRGGFVTGCDARIVGEVVRDLGGGRFTKETVIHHEVGVDRLAAVGESVNSGGILCRVHAVDKAMAEEALARLQTAFTILETPPRLTPLIYEVL